MPKRWHELAIGLLATSLAGASGGCFLANSPSDEAEPPEPPLEAPDGAGEPDAIPPPPSIRDEPADVPADEPADVPADEPADVPADEPAVEPGGGGGPAVAFQPELGHAFQQASFVGDMDGDGRDDLVLFSTQLNDGTLGLAGPEAVLYLFYGRDAFDAESAEIDVTSADAVIRDRGFDVFAYPGGVPLGDVNGDGLADLVVVGVGWVHFVFGQETRLGGDMEIEAVGARWTFSDLQAMGALPFGAPIVTAAGDANGDGLADFALTLPTGVVQSDVAPSSFAVVHEVYLVAGREGAWPAGPFDPASAIATCRGSEPAASCMALAASDLDGDGYTDLLLDDGGTPVLVSGAGGTLLGPIVPAELGRPIQRFGSEPRRLLDFDGDGRAELAWGPSTDEVGVVTYGDGDWDAVGVDTLSITAAGAPLSGFDVADFNGDGHADLVAISIANESEAGGFYVVPGDGSRRLGSLPLEAQPLLRADGGDDGEDAALAGQFGYALDARGDFNADGYADALALMYGGGVDHVVLIPGRALPSR